MTNPFVSTQGNYPTPSASDEDDSILTGLVSQSAESQLAELLAEIRAGHRVSLEVLEQMKRANDLLVVLYRQQKIQAGAVLRGELREYNNKAALWKPLPLLDGDPFPHEDRDLYPCNIRALREMPMDRVRLLAVKYEINPDDTDQRVRDYVVLFLSGLRA